MTYEFLKEYFDKWFGKDVVTITSIENLYFCNACNKHMAKEHLCFSDVSMVVK